MSTVEFGRTYRGQIVSEMRGTRVLHDLRVGLASGSLGQPRRRGAYEVSRDSNVRIGSEETYPSGPKEMFPDRTVSSSEC